MDTRGEGYRKCAEPVVGMERQDLGEPDPDCQRERVLVPGLKDGVV